MQEFKVNAAALLTSMMEVLPTVAELKAKVEEEMVTLCTPVPETKFITPMVGAEL